MEVLLGASLRKSTIAAQNASLVSDGAEKSQGLPPNGVVHVGAANEF